MRYLCPECGKPYTPIVPRNILPVHGRRWRKGSLSKGIPSGWENCPGTWQEITENMKKAAPRKPTRKHA